MGAGWTSSRAAQQRRDLLARSAAAAGDGEDAQAPAAPRGGRRHCWVVLDDLEPMPGVVAAWERTEAGV